MHFTNFGQLSAPLTLLTYPRGPYHSSAPPPGFFCCPGTIRRRSPSRSRPWICYLTGRLDSELARVTPTTSLRASPTAPAEAEPRFEEVLSLQVRALASQTPFSHLGRFFRLDDVVVEPPPHQWRHPPAVAGGQQRRLDRGPARGAASISCADNSFPLGRSRSASRSTDASSRRPGPGRLELTPVERDALRDLPRGRKLVEQEIEAAPRAGGDRAVAAGRQPHRRMRPLVRRRFDNHLVEAEEAATVGERSVGGERAHQHVEHLLEARLGLGGRHGEACELVVAVAFADSEIEPAVREKIQGRNLLGKQHRVVPGQHQDRRAEAQARRAGREDRSGG